MGNSVDEFIKGLNEDQKKIINDLFEVMGGQADVELALLEGTKELHDDADYKRELSERDMDRMQNFIGEFLKNYIISGYTFDGKRIFINASNTPEEYDSNFTLGTRVIPYCCENTMDEDGLDEEYQDFD